MPALVAGGLLAGPPSAGAVVFNVTTTQDSTPQAGACVPGDPNCTLREAVLAANAAASSDQIKIPAGLYSLTIENPSPPPPPPPDGENAAALGDLDLINNGSLTITGAGARLTTINGNSIDRVFDVRQSAVVDISGVKIAGGVLTRGTGGGAIRVDGNGASPVAKLTVTDSTISGSRAQLGAGIYATNKSDVTLTNSTVSGNIATKVGGGIANDPAGGSAVLALKNSTVSGNAQTDTQPLSMLDYGGGGISNNGGTASLSFTTVAGNSSTAGGGGIQNTGGGFQTKNSIISGNSDPSPKTNCDSTITSLGFNLEQGTSCGMIMGSDVHGDPKLAPLGDYGGPTNTMLPKSGSAALGNADTVSCSPTDQRGVLRPQGVGCDIGSDETETTDVSISKSDSPDPVMAGETLTYTIKVTNGGLQAAHGVTVTDVLPSGVTPQSADATQGTCSGGQTKICSLGNIGVGSSATIEILVQASTAGTVSNTATVSIANIDSNSANNSASTSTTVSLAKGRCANIFRGNSGNNTINGTPEGDAISGYGGKDKLSGFGGEDCLYGGTGNDSLFGGSGNDFLYGGSGNDFLKGGKGKDRIRGEGGNDTIVANDGKKDNIDCGPGFDRATVDEHDIVKNCEVVTSED